MPPVGRGVLTSCITTAYSPVRRARRPATYITNFGIVQSLAYKVLAVHVFNTPETTRSQVCLLGAVGDVDGRAGALGDA